MAVGLAGCALPEKNPAARAPAMPTVGAAPAPAEVAPVARLAALVRADRPAEAVAVLATITDPTLRARRGAELLRAVADEPSDRLALLAEAWPAGVGQGEALEFVGRTLARRRPSAAITWASTLRDPAAAAVATRAVIAQWVEMEPRGAADYFAALGDAKAEAQLGFAVAAWSQREPDAALAWSRGQSDAARRARLLLAAGFAMAQTAPRRALALADELPAGRDRWLLVSAAAQTWVAADRAAALAWVRDLPEGASRDAALAGIETGLGVPSTRRRGSGPGQRSIASRGLGGGALVWAADSPDFNAWLATQPPGRDRDEALLDYVRQRGALDTGAMGQWLASLPGSPARTRALELYVESRLGSAPAEAAAFLRTLPRSDVPDALLEQVARRWLITNPDAAVPWLRDAPMPEFQKDRLLREAGR